MPNMWGKELKDYLSEEDLKAHHWLYKHLPVEEQEKANTLVLKIQILRHKFKYGKPLSIKDVLTEEELKEHLHESNRLSKHKQKTHNEETIIIFVMNYFDEIHKDLTLEDLWPEDKFEKFKEYYKKYSPNTYEAYTKETAREIISKRKSYYLKRYKNLKSVIHIENIREEYFLKNPEKREEYYARIKQKKEEKKKNQANYKEFLNKHSLTETMHKAEIEQQKTMRSLNYTALVRGPYYYVIRCPFCHKWCIKEYMTLIKRTPVNKKFCCNSCGRSRRFFNKKKGNIEFLGEFYKIEHAQREYHKIIDEKLKKTIELERSSLPPDKKQKLGKLFEIKETNTATDKVRLSKTKIKTIIFKKIKELEEEHKRAITINDLSEELKYFSETTNFPLDDLFDYLEELRREMKVYSPEWKAYKII